MKGTASAHVVSGEGSVAVVVSPLFEWLETKPAWSLVCILLCFMLLIDSEQRRSCVVERVFEDWCRLLYWSGTHVCMVKVWFQGNATMCSAPAQGVKVSEFLRLLLCELGCLYLSLLFRSFVATASSFKNLFGSKRNLLAHVALENEEDVSFFQLPTSSPLAPSSPVMLKAHVPGSHERWFEGSYGAATPGHTPPREGIDQSPLPPAGASQAAMARNGGSPALPNGGSPASTDSKKSSPSSKKHASSHATRKGFTRRDADENGFETSGWNDKPRTPKSPLSKLVALRWGAGKLDRPAFSLRSWGSDSHAVAAHTVRVLGPPTGTFEKDYDAVEVLHQESQRTLSLCLRKSTGELRACRTVLKQSLFAKEDIDELQGEIQILKLLGSNPHIARFHGVYEDDYAVRLITEYCAGLPIVERILREEQWTERAAQRTMRSIVEVVKHCHDSCMVHRDIRLGSFLLEDSKGSVLKTLDFSSTVFIAPGETLTEKVGTPLYTAPEVLDGRYGLPCDIWSAGVCLHILLSGRAPFIADTVAGIRECTRRAELDLTHPWWDVISPSAKDLLRTMLANDPSLRPTAEEILKHPWMEEDPPAVEIKSTVFPPLRDLLTIAIFHQDTLSALAEFCSEKDVALLSKSLAQKDDGTGTVDFVTLYDCIEHLARPEIDSRMAPLMRMVVAQEDLEERGRMDRVALIRAVAHAVRQRWEAQLATALRHADMDHRGLIPSPLVWDACKDVGVMDIREVEAALLDPGLSQGAYIESEAFLSFIHQAGEKHEPMDLQILML